jgi:hypothetical protein
VLREPGKFVSLVSMAWVGGLAMFAERLSTSRYVRSACGALGAPKRTAEAPDVPRNSSWLHAAAMVVATSVIAAAPIALTPGLAWGVGGRLRAVRYPAAWESARSSIEQRRALDNQPGTIVVLPWTNYTDAGFTNGRITRSTARVYFGPSAEISDDAEVPGLTPSARTAAIQAALGDPQGAAKLARLGVRFVVVPPGQTAAVLRSLPRVTPSRDSSLYEVFDK